MIIIKIFYAKSENNYLKLYKVKCVLQKNYSLYLHLMSVRMQFFSIMI